MQHLTPQIFGTGPMDSIQMFQAVLDAPPSGDDGINDDLQSFIMKGMLHYCSVSQRTKGYIPCCKQWEGKYYSTPLTERNALHGMVDRMMVEASQLIMQNTWKIYAKCTSTQL